LGRDGARSTGCRTARSWFKRDRRGAGAWPEKISGMVSLEYPPRPSIGPFASMTTNEPPEARRAEASRRRGWARQACALSALRRSTAATIRRTCSRARATAGLGLRPRGSGLNSRQQRCIYRRRTRTPRGAPGLLGGLSFLAEFVSTAGPDGWFWAV